MIQLLQRPYDICWSGNPITYTLFSSSAAVDNNAYLQVRVYFFRTDTVQSQMVHQFDHVAVEGMARFDLQDILDGLLQYEVPPVSGEHFASKKMTGRFWIEAREITSENNDPQWSFSEFLYRRFVIKGGIAYEKWRGDNFWINYFNVKKPFLTWQISGKLVAAKEISYLAWLNTTTVSNSNIKLRVTVTYTDLSTTIFNNDIPCAEGEVEFINCSYHYLGIGLLSDKKIYTWECQVFNIHDNSILSESFVFELDNRPDYNNTCLNYRNSLGGLDNILVRGLIEYSAERSFTNIETIAINHYYQGNSIIPRIKSINATEWIVKKGNIGHLPHEEADRVRDIHFAREVWQFLFNKWIPVVLLSENETINKSDDTRWGLSITFATASNGNRYYTPDSIDLQEGSAPPESCISPVLSSFSLDGGQEMFYQRVAAIIGTNPFSLTILSKPQWMDMYISDNKLYFAGSTMNKVGSWNVHFKISNCSETVLEVSKTFNISF